MASAKAPHRAVLLVKLEVHDILPTGELSGHIVSESELNAAGIKTAQIVNIDGFDKHDCLRRLKEKLDVLRAN